MSIINPLLLKLFFNTIGWFFTSLIWSQFRGQEVSWDPDFRGAITNNLLDAEFAATNLAVSAGGVNNKEDIDLSQMFSINFPANNNLCHLECCSHPWKH